MATTVLRGGFELEIDDGTIYHAFGGQRQPMLLTEIVFETDVENRGLMVGHADARFVTMGGPEPRPDPAPSVEVFVPNEDGGRRLRVRDGG